MSHSKILKFRTSTNEFWAVTIQPVTNGFPQNPKVNIIGNNHLGNQKQKISEYVGGGGGLYYKEGHLGRSA